MGTRTRSISYGIKRRNWTKRLVTSGGGNHLRSRLRRLYGATGGSWSRHTITRHAGQMWGWRPLRRKRLRMKQPTFGKLIGEPDHPLWDLLQFIAVISGLVVILLLTASSFDETELKTIGAMVIVTVLVPALKRTLIKWRVTHRRFVNENPRFQRHERPCGAPVIFADMLSTRIIVWPNVNNLKPYLHINAHIPLNLIKNQKRRNKIFLYFFQ